MPIQCKAVDASKYNSNGSDGDGDGINRLVVSQVVKFGDGAQLAVDALVSTAEYPLEELTARKGTGNL